MDEADDEHEKATQLGEMEELNRAHLQSFENVNPIYSSKVIAFVPGT